MRPAAGRPAARERCARPGDSGRCRPGRPSPRRTGRRPVRSIDSAGWSCRIPPVRARRIRDPAGARSRRVRSLARRTIPRCSRGGWTATSRNAATAGRFLESSRPRALAAPSPSARLIPALLSPAGGGGRHRKCRHTRAYVAAGKESPRRSSLRMRPPLAPGWCRGSGTSRRAAETPPRPTRNVMSTLDLARLQFAMTSIYHFLFVPVTIGLSLAHRDPADAGTSAGTGRTCGSRVSSGRCW